MARVLILNPSQWGRGITPIWIASHTAVLTRHGHDVALFDATFFKDWSKNENQFNTLNKQYLPSDYENKIVLNEEPVVQALQKKIDGFKPDVVFWAAISSHIHGEGEYVAIQFGDELMRQVKTDALKVCGGLQSTASPVGTAERFPNIDCFLGGESEFILKDLVSAIEDKTSLDTIAGLTRRVGGQVITNPRQSIISNLDDIGPYDYRLFDDQVFYRPYLGKVVRAVDFELSRGCPYTCGYCVETVIQKYYGFTDKTPRGFLKGANQYLRAKSGKRVFEEISWLYHERGVTFFRCQDTNFLTVNRKTLNELAELLEEAKLPIKLYVETRSEGITQPNVELLKRLQVDGVGMGLELSTQEFREEKLNRFSDQASIIRAYKILREAGIHRTAYNIIGIPDQTEKSILETIEFNRMLDPDNVTVAFYTPYLGTEQQKVGTENNYFKDYEFDLDSQLRTMTHHSLLSAQTLAFYKRNFVRLVRDGLASLKQLKEDEKVG